MVTLLAGLACLRIELVGLMRLIPAGADARVAQQQIVGGIGPRNQKADYQKHLARSHLLVGEELVGGGGAGGCLLRCVSTAAEALV